MYIDINKVSSDALIDLFKGQNPLHNSINDSIIRHARGGTNYTLFTGDTYSFKPLSYKHTVIAEKINQKQSSGFAITGDLLTYFQAYKKLLKAINAFKKEADSVVNGLSNASYNKLDKEIEIKKKYGETSVLSLKRIGGVVLAGEKIINKPDHELREADLAYLKKKEKELKDDAIARFKKAADASYPEIQVLYSKLDELAEKPV